MNLSQLIETVFNYFVVSSAMRVKGLAADDVDGACGDDDDRHKRNHAFQHHQQFRTRRYRQSIGWAERCRSPID